MIEQILSSPLAKALYNDSRNLEWTQIFTKTTAPQKYDGTNGTDGVFLIGDEGMMAPRGLVLIPFCGGEQGANFWVRLYGWRQFGKDPGTLLWIPMILAEFACIATFQGGFRDHVIAENERFVDSIGLSAGSGSIVAPGAGQVAYMTVPLLGSQRVQFDIVCGDELPAFGNCLFATI